MSDDSIRLKNINHITYNVRNKDAALKWYTEVLGLKQIPKMVDSDRLYWLQLPSGAMVHIIENADAPSAPSHHTAFEVDDLDAARDAMVGKGLEVTEIQTRHDGQRACYLEDPDGNRILGSGCWSSVPNPRIPRTIHRLNRKGPQGPLFYGGRNKWD